MHHIVVAIHALHAAAADTAATAAAAVTARSVDPTTPKQKQAEAEQQQHGLRDGDALLVHEFFGEERQTGAEGDNLVLVLVAVGGEVESDEVPELVVLLALSSLLAF